MEAFIKWRCSKCWREFDTQKEAEECEKHHGLPVKVVKAKKCSQYDEDGFPGFVDVLMDNGRIGRYRYYINIVSSVWEEEKES